MIRVIDYGMGNLRSVVNAITTLGHPVAVATDPAQLRAAEGVILPGVGAFADGMRNLRERGWCSALEEEVRGRRKPFLGLCLGMELLASSSTEHGMHEGLGWIPGSVERIDPGPDRLPVPHIGWNDVRIVAKDGLYAGLGDSESFYFVHAYVFAPRDAAVVSGICSYGAEFAASVESENLWATQYHPEKSHRAGLAVLRNFVGRVEGSASSRSA